MKNKFYFIFSSFLMLLSLLTRLLHIRIMNRFLLMNRLTVLLGLIIYLKSSFNNKLGFLQDCYSIVFEYFI